MATSGSISTNSASYDGSSNYLEVRWTVSQSGNVSTVNWTLYLMGGPQRLRTIQALLKIVPVAGTLNVTSSPDGQTGTIASEKVYTLLGYNTTRPVWTKLNQPSSIKGTFTITHNSSGAGKFKIQLHGNIATHGNPGWGGGNASSTLTEFELPTTISACGAPASVTITGTIIKPNDSFTVSWSGASGGTNNSINGYTVYYAITSGGSNPTTSSASVHVSSTTTSGSTTITLSNATRGYIIRCAVRTEGVKGSSYYSGLKYGSNTIKINQLPEPPTLDQSSQIIKSTEYTTGISVTATAGADPDGQTVEVWYATSQEGTKVIYPNPSSINPTQGNSITWYFYTKDSLGEYSSPTEITITRNLKPVLTAGSYTKNDYTIGGSSGVNGNNLGYAYGMTPSLKCNKSCNLRITRQYRIGSSTTWQDGISTLFAYSINTNPTNLENYNLFEQVPDLNDTANFYWRLKVEATGDLDSSNTIYFPPKQSNNDTYFTIAPFMGSGANVFNKFADENVTGSNQNQVYRQLRIKFSADTSISSYSVSAGSDITGISYVTSTSNNSTQIDVTLPDNINPGTQIVCTVTGQTVTGAQFTRSRVITPVTETLAPNLSNEINPYPTSISPFTASGTYAVSIVDPLSGGTFSQYNIQGQESIKLIAASTQDGTGAYEISSTSSTGASWVQSGDTRKKNFNLTDFHKWSNPWNLSYDGVKTYYARIEITNVFGKKYVSPWTTATFNFVENLKSIAIGNFQWSSSSAGTYRTLDSGSTKGRLWEGMYLKITPTISYWTKGTITINLFDTNNTLVATQTKDVTAATNQTAATKTGEFIIGPLGEFSTNGDYTYKVVAQLNGTTESVQSFVAHPVGQLTAASYILTSATVEKKTDNKYYINYAISGNAGIDTSLTNPNPYTVTRKIAIGSEEPYTKELLITLDSGQVNSTLETWNVQQVRLLTTVSVSAKPNSSDSQLYSITKESTSPVVIVYSSSPTVAYRANHLGINTNSIDDGATLVVQATSNRNLVLLKGATATIHINLEEARIY